MIPFSCKLQTKFPFFALCRIYINIERSPCVVDIADIEFTVFLMLRDANFDESDAIVQRISLSLLKTKRRLVLLSWKFCSAELKQRHKGNLYTYAVSDSLYSHLLPSLPDRTSRLLPQHHISFHFPRKLFMAHISIVSISNT